MTDVEVIDHESSVGRSWGVIVGDQHYQADVEVIAHGCEEPPSFLMFVMVPLPDFPTRLPDGAAGPMPTVTLEDWFMVGATPGVAERACTLISANLSPVTLEEFVALGESRAQAAPQPPLRPPNGVEGSGGLLLAPADFAGPNRAQRRARGRR